MDGFGQTTFVIISDGDDHTQEGVFVGGLQSDAWTTPKQQWTYVQRSVRPVRWNIIQIVLHNLFASFHEQVGREFRHESTTTTRLHPCSILVGSEQMNGIVGMTECLESFEARLSVMQCRSSNVQLNVRFGHQLRCLPGAVTVHHP